MGLDALELVLEIEEKFGISIADAEAEKVSTPRMLIDLILSKLEVSEEKICQSQRAFYLLRNTLMKKFGLNRSAITPDTEIRAIISKEQQASAWLDFKNALQAQKWPELVRPNWIVWITSLFGGVLFAAIMAVAEFKIKKNYGLFTSVCPAIVLIFGLSLIILLVLEQVTRPFKVLIPANMKCLRDLVPYVISSAQIKWSREKVAQMVKTIIVEQLGLSPSKYREDANFVKDYGF